MTKLVSTGQLIKALRQEKKLSQEALAMKSDSSSRYISFIETGRAHPSRPLLLRLARELNVDKQVINDLLVSAGYSPLQPASASKQEREEVLSILKKLVSANPYPAIISNRYGNILAYNAVMDATIRFLLGSSDFLDCDSANIHILELDPKLCRPHIVNLAQQENIRINFLHQQCLCYPDDTTFKQLYDQLIQFKANTSEAADKNIEQCYFSQLHLKSGSQNIKFYWFYSAIGSNANQLSEDLQVLSAVPSDAKTEQWFQGLTR